MAKRVRSPTVSEGYSHEALADAEGRNAEVALANGRATDTLRVRPCKNFKKQKKIVCATRRRAGAYAPALRAPPKNSDQWFKKGDSPTLTENRYRCRGSRARRSYG